MIIYYGLLFVTWNHITVHKWLTFGLISLSDGISTFVGYLMLKPPLLKNSSDYYLTDSWKDKKIYTFPKGFSRKVNVLAQLEFDLAYIVPAVQHFSHYFMVTLSSCIRYEYLKLYDWV